MFYLFQYKHNVVDKQELKTYGWQGKAVSDSSLLVAISEIRHVIGKENILTVAKEGYMFFNAVAEDHIA